VYETTYQLFKRRLWIKTIDQERTCVFNEIEIDNVEVAENLQLQLIEIET
jgi:hypothetical protein